MAIFLDHVDPRRARSSGHPPLGGSSARMRRTRVHEDGRRQDVFLYARRDAIAGGSNEIMRNMIAERARVDLGSPGMRT